MRHGTEVHPDGSRRPRGGARQALRRIDKRVRRHLRTGLSRVLGRPAPVAPDALEGIDRILLIRTNFRMGNVLVAAPVIDVFRERFPDARIDFLVADTTAALLEHQPIDTVFTVSRSFIPRPWRVISLLRRLRRERHDLAVQITPGSFSGALVTRLVGARYTMGRAGGDDRGYNVAVTAAGHHAHDTAVPFARALGVPPRRGPGFRLGTAERERARAQLRALGIGRGSGFVGLFIGGHRDKRWPLPQWVELCRRLDAGGVRFLAFLGPEEAELGPALQAALEDCGNGTLVHPRPLREFAALVGQAELLVTPDSGPMHLAAALDVPTIAVVRRTVSLKYVPRGERHRALRDPAPEGVYHEVLQARTARAAGDPARLARRGGRDRWIVTEAPPGPAGAVSRGAGDRP